MTHLAAISLERGACGVGTISVGLRDGEGIRWALANGALVEIVFTGVWLHTSTDKTVADPEPRHAGNDECT